MLCYLDDFSEKYVTQTYVDWLNDKELMKYSEQRHYIHSRESCMEYLRSFEGTSNLLYAVLDSKTHQHVGNINAYIDSFNSTADIGVLVGVTGKGYGFSAWTQMINKLFTSKHKVRKITAGTMSINTPMLRIFKKSGMSYEYTKLRHFDLEGRLVDMEVYFKENIK